MISIHAQVVFLGSSSWGTCMLRLRASLYPACLGKRHSTPTAAKRLICYLMFLLATAFMFGHSLISVSVSIASRPYESHLITQHTIATYRPLCAWCLVLSCPSEANSISKVMLGVLSKMLPVAMPGFFINGYNQYHGSCWTTKQQNSDPSLCPLSPRASTSWVVHHTYVNSTRL